MLTPDTRASLIRSILVALEQSLRSKNEVLARQSRHTEQVAFDRVDTFFYLTFLSDESLRSVADAL